MLTDMTHPPFQRPGEGVLGESDLIVSRGVRVEGYVDLPAHKRDALPVEDHLAILLPVPDAQQRYGHLAPREQGIRLFSPSQSHNTREMSLKPSSAGSGMPRATSTLLGCSYLMTLPGFSGSGLGSSGLILEKRILPSIPRTGITRAGVRRWFLANPRFMSSSGSVAVQYPRAWMTSSEIPDAEFKAFM